VSSVAEGAPTSARSALPREVWALVGANAVVALGYGVVAPVLPQLARHFGVSISAATFVITAFALMRLLAAPPTGRLVQRLGERRIYVSGLLIVAVSTAACAFAESYWQLLTFRALGGIGSTMFFVSALGLMIRMSPPEIYGVLLLFAAAVVLVSLRNSPLAGPAAKDQPTVTLRTALGHRAYRAALLSNFATGWSLFGLRFALVPLFVSEGLRQSPGVAGLALTAFALGNVTAVIPSGRLSDSVGRKPLLVTGLSLAGLSTAVLGLAPSLPLFLGGALIAGLASGVFNSPQQAAVADIIGQARGGTAIATFQMMSDFGSIVGSIGVGLIAGYLSFAWSFGLSGAILVIAAVGWAFAPETRDESPLERTPARPLGPEATGELT